MIAVRHLDYLVKVDVVETAGLLLMEPIGRCDELAVSVPLVVLLALYPSTVVLSLIHGFSLSLTLVFA